MQPKLIEIQQDMPGFGRFIGSWLCQGNENIVVDVGPSCSVEQLVKSMTDLGIHRVDFVLLTHIHIDHAGGLAAFLERFPMARVVCHLKGIKHLVEPSRLWKGSLETLGEIAQIYGPIAPVHEEKLIAHTDARVKGLEIIETPGHAAHHLSFTYEGNLFAGEACGIYLTVRGSEYLRPATPPVFLMPEFLRSIDRMLAMDDQPICFAHLGQAERSHHLLRRERDQLLRWQEIIKEEISKGGESPLERCATRLLAADHELRAFEAMGPEEQQREKFFMANSVKGFLGYLSSQSGG
jgi:glyoxylase-like metal-dependent hydrolase (beta-lactamase superfamily II)